MINYLATWFYSSPSGQKIYYPGVGSNSDEWAFQKTYWHCILTCMDRLACIYRGDPSIRLVVFLSEKAPFEAIRFQLDLESFLRLRQISIVYFTPQFPLPSSQDKFLTQFYIYDVLDAASKFLNSQDTLTLLDSDILPLNTISAEYFTKVIEKGCAFYPIKWVKTTSTTESHGTNSHKSLALLRENRATNTVSLNNLACIMPIF